MLFILRESDLCGLWPAAFNDCRRPLKRGIHEDMNLERDNPVMQAWVKHPAYLLNLITHEHRFDLDGQPVELVRDVERMVALKELRGWIENRESFFGSLISATTSNGHTRAKLIHSNEFEGRSW